jgi:Protein of unknown function (DUF2808)
MLLNNMLKNSMLKNNAPKEQDLNNRRELVKQVYLTVATTAACLLIGLGEGAKSLDLHSISFEHAPRLSRMAIANQKAYFTVTIPKNAGEDLARLSFSDLAEEGTRLPFNLEKTQVFIGERANGRSVEVASAWVDETGVVWVEFGPPLAPGTTFTVVMEVGKNAPSGSREYGIAAYPKPENSVPAFVGDGSLTFE